MSNPFRIMVVDDEPIARRGVERLLSGDPDIELVGEAGSGREAVAEIKRVRPDVLFLDIQMPDLDGFEVLRALGPDVPAAVVFLTAHDQHALRAFEVSALDYVLKPFDDERFIAALHRAKQHARRIREGDLTARLTSLLGGGAAGGASQYADRVAVRVGARISFVNVQNILFVRASGNYVEIKAGTHLHVLRNTLSEMEANLDPSLFVRIHRSTIVAVNAVKHVESLFRGEYAVVMQDGTKLQSSARYRDSLEKAFGLS